MNGTPASIIITLCYSYSLIMINRPSFRFGLLDKSRKHEHSDLCHTSLIEGNGAWASNISLFRSPFSPRQGIRLVGIGPEDVVDGKPVLILGLIWSVIQFFHITQIEIVLVSWYMHYPYVKNSEIIKLKLCFDWSSHLPTILAVGTFMTCRNDSSNNKSIIIIIIIIINNTNNDEDTYYVNIGSIKVWDVWRVLIIWNIIHQSDLIFRIIKNNFFSSWTFILHCLVCFPHSGLGREEVRERSAVALESTQNWGLP